MGVRLVRLVTIAIALLALAPGQSQARTDVLRLPRGFFTFGNPEVALAGDKLVYRDGVRFSPYSVRVAGPNGQDRELVRFEGGTVQFAASSGLVAVRHGADVLAGSTPDSPLTPISHCASSAPVVDQTNVAFLEEACGQHAIVVQESGATPATHRIELPPDAQIDSLSIAGPYVAYRSTSHGGHDIVVDDWQTGAEAMRSPVASEMECGQTTVDNQPTASFCGIGIQADGTVAELIGRFVSIPPGPSRYEQGYVADTCGGTIYRLAPDDPNAHAIWAKACVRGPVQIASGRVLFASHTIIGIGVVDLAGQERELGFPNEVYGFDGAHVFVNEENCVAATVVSSSVLGDDPALAFTRSENHCTAKLLNPEVTIGPHGSRLEATLYCRHGCLGPVTVGTYDYVDAASEDFELLPGGTKRLTFRLPANSDIVRRARGKRQVRIRFTTFEPTDVGRESPVSTVARGGARNHRLATAAVKDSRHRKTWAQTGPR
jgi:hypothetical protein